MPPLCTHDRSDESDGRRPGAAAGSRWLLWVDAAGGYLVLGGQCWTIGGPASEAEAAICVQADLRRQHAQLARAGRDYALYPAAGGITYPADAADSLRPPGAANSPAADWSRNGAAHRCEPVPLRCSDRFLLGRSVGFHFVQPSPLSSSARLAVDPPHRLRPHVDGVLLWADTLVIGPTLDCHVVVPHAEGPIVLLQRDGRWLAKGSGGSLPSEGNGAETVRLVMGERVQQRGVSMTLEPA